jgi:hypothetical protein
MFVSNVGAYLRLLKVISWMGKLENPARSKHSSLLDPFVSYKENSVLKRDPRGFTIKHYGSVMYGKWTNFVIS